MDWSNERYVRIYTRDTDDWIALSWEARAVFVFVVRAVDRAGVLQTRRGARGVAGVIRMPADIVEAALAELLADGSVVEHELGFAVRNYIEAQEASQSDRQRKRDARERRAAGSSGLHATHGQPVTKRDSVSDSSTAAGQAVTSGHDESHSVTFGHSVPSRADLSRADLSRAAPPARALDPTSTEHGTGLAAGTDRLRPVDAETGARGDAIAALWAEHQELRKAIAAELGVTVMPLHPFDPGRRELCARVREWSADGGVEAALEMGRFALARLGDEARSTGTVRYLDGGLWKQERVAVALAREALDDDDGVVANDPRNRVL